MPPAVESPSSAQWTAALCLTQALARAAAAQVITYDYFRLPVLATLGVFLFNDPLNTAMILGGLCILLACWINFQATQPAPARSPKNHSACSHDV